MYKKLNLIEIQAHRPLSKLVEVEVTETLHMDRLSKVARQKIVLGLRTGVLAAVSGVTGFVYNKITDKYQIPAIRVGTDGTVVVNNRVNSDIRDQILAVAKLMADNPEKKDWYTGVANRAQIFCGGLKVKTVRGYVGNEYKSEYRDRIRDAIAFAESGKLVKSAHLGAQDSL